ncbi:CsgG/HfaB family protein [Bacteroidota bacterium]
MNIIKSFLIILILSVIIIGCAPFMHQPLEPKGARLGPETNQYDELTSLPVPSRKIIAAIYKFRDQTGQYKPTETGASWSTAVTQGATTILTRIVQESNWFVPIERENVGNLLNERKIIRSSQAQYKSNQNEEVLLPALLFAEIILEGGIISYETNVITGGAGLRYFGSGGGSQYREDRITVYLRAVATTSGKILKTVYTSKSILSQQIDVGVFRFVDIQKLLEFEAGITYNEPSEIALTEAMEKAVIALIAEGVKDGFWQLQEPADTANATFVDYYKEKELNKDIDHLNRILKPNQRGKFYLGPSGSILNYGGDIDKSTPALLGEVELGVKISPHLFASAKAGKGELKSKDYLFTRFNKAEFAMNYISLPYDRVSWVFSVQGGVADIYEYENFKGDKFTFPYVGVSCGLEWMIKGRIGVTTSMFYNYFIDDKFDGYEAGNYNDYFWGGTVGIRYYLLRGLKAKTKKQDRTKYLIL